MINIVVNTNLLREIDERNLINRYARFCYNGEEDTNNDTLIKQNLAELLDWDANGDNGLPVYCSKFESLKEKDWLMLIDLIKSNHYEIKQLSYRHRKIRRLASKKELMTYLESKENRNKERCENPDYKVSGRGKKARSCVYEGREYSSRQECQYKEGLSKNELYQYLKRTNQI